MTTWAEWDLGMDFAEFCEVIARIAVLRTSVVNFEFGALTLHLPRPLSFIQPALRHSCRWDSSAAERLWRRIWLSSKSFFFQSNRALDVGMQMPFCSLCLRHSQIHTPL